MRPQLPSPSATATAAVAVAAVAAIVVFALLPAPGLCSATEPSNQREDESLKYDKLRSRLDLLHETLAVRLMDFPEKDMTDVLDTLHSLVDLLTDDCAEQTQQPRHYDTQSIKQLVKEMKTELLKKGVTERRAAKTTDVMSNVLFLALRFAGVCSSTFKAAYRTFTS